MTHEVGETYLVERALHVLCKEHNIWTRNLNTWYRMNPNDRIWWWRSAKKQAELGAPAMQTLLAKVIELRMTS